jgi:glycosyltransferase involved in cell wall biosynthesis
MLKKCVVVLPTFNEKENLESFTKEVLATEKLMPGWRIDLVIADSATEDNY